MPDSRRDWLTHLFHETGALLQRRMRRFSRTPADAEDATQEAFLRAVEYEGPIRAPDGFLYHAARNVAFDRLRRDKVVRSFALGGIPPSAVDHTAESAEAELLAEERTRVLKEAVDRLPPQCQRVFVLRVFQGLSYKEIAKTLGLSAKTVEHHLARGVHDVYAHVRTRLVTEETRDE